MPVASSSMLRKFGAIIFNFVLTFIRVCSEGMCALWLTDPEVRGQFVDFGSLLLPCRFQGYWCWWQALVPTEPSQ